MTLLISLSSFVWEYSYTPPSQSTHPTTSSTKYNLPNENSVKPSTLTGLSDPLGQYGMEFDSFCAKYMSNVQGPQQIALTDPLGQYAIEFDSFCAESASKAEGYQVIDSQPPSHEEVDGNISQPVSHEHLQKSEAVDDRRSGRRLSNEQTEFPSGLQETLDDELLNVAATLDLEYEHVHGHLVKKEISGLVGAIFEKYGDITAESDVRSPETISFFLERICGVYQILKQMTFFDLAGAEINDMLDELRDLEKQKLNVGWLLERVEEISETKSSFQNYPTIKREAGEIVESNERIDKEIEQYQMQIALIRRKIALAEEEKRANEAKVSEYTRMAVDGETEIEAVANESLVHGLL